jgi:outer membrane protein assembly factor BamB
VSSRVPAAYQTGGLIWGSAVVNPKGDVFVGSADKKVYGLSPTGHLYWSYSIHDRPDALIDSASALASSGMLVVPGGDGYLHAVDSTTGAKLWEFKAYHVDDSTQSSGSSVNSFEGNVQIAPDGTILAGSDNGHLYALDANGHEKWNFQTGMMVWSSPAFHPDGRWLAFGSLDHRLYLLDPKTGKQLFSYDTGSEVKSSPAVDSAGRIYVGTSGNQLLALSVRPTWWGWGGDDLVLDWSFDTKGEVYSSPALYKDKVIFGSLDGNIYAVSTSGNLLWRFPIFASISSSPIVTADGLVVFGARNGKIYVLDAETGVRMFSYRTTDTMVKSNLDASPAVTPDGTIVVGSYDGRIYYLPFEYCWSHRSASVCEFGGNQDLPDFGGDVPSDGTVFRFENENGILSPSNTKALYGSSLIRLRIVTFENGQFISNAAVNPVGLSVSAKPHAEGEVMVSSDGKYVNLIPKTFWSPGTTYKIRLRGTYYHQTHWFWDRFKWFFLPEFDAEVTIATDSDGGTAPMAENQSWAVRSMFLYQPQSLETYIPAALDGQAFLYNPFYVDAAKGKYLSVVLPAFPKDTGIIPFAEPSRAFSMGGSMRGHSIRAEGKFALAAMGGAAQFDRALFVGRLGDDGTLNRAEFFVLTPCLNLKGNGSSYVFPMALIDATCDSQLRLVGIGKFESPRVPAADKALAVSLGTQGVKVKGADLTVNLSAPAKTWTVDRLLTYVEYDPEAPAIVTSRFERIPARADGASTITVRIPKVQVQESIHEFLVMVDWKNVAQATGEELDINGDWSRWPTRSISGQEHVD